MGSKAIAGQLQPHKEVGLFSEAHGPTYEGGKPPVLLIHGFASSSELNWHRTGWVAALTEAGRRVITIDLPAHGNSEVPVEAENQRPSRIVGSIRAVLAEKGVRPLNACDRGSGVDIVGYSLGSRLAWDIAVANPAVVRRLVLGGPTRQDPLTDFDLEAARRFVTHGDPVHNTETAGLLKMAQLVPANDLDSLLNLVEQIQMEPFDPAGSVPGAPMLLVAGDKDDLAVSMPKLAELSPLAQMLWLPARNHANAVSSRAFKTAAVQFLD